MGSSRSDDRICGTAKRAVLLVEPDYLKRPAAQRGPVMISRDDAFAKGFRLAWRNIPIAALLVLLAVTLYELGGWGTIAAIIMVVGMSS